jgi:ABC-type transport system substrate-binding protein
VRRAFYHSIDKISINEVGQEGLGRVADSWIAPEDPRRPLFKDVIPEWFQDVRLAQQLLEEAGWRKGSDGVPVHSTTGERMETEVRVTGAQAHVKILSVIANDWRQVGAQVRETVIPTALLSDNEYRATFPFVGHTAQPVDLLWEHSHYSCTRVARPEDRWSGNRNGYCNSVAEPLIERLQVTISEQERTSLQAQIMRIVLKEDYGQLPLYWSVLPVASARGVTGLVNLTPGPYGASHSPWNIHMWDKL